MKRNLAQLRAALRIFRGRAALGRDEKLADLEYKFFFTPDEGEDATEISEECFNATPGDESGHPQPGTYEVRATSRTTGEVMLKESGTWQEKKDVGGDEKPAAESIADAAKKIVGLAVAQAESASFDGVKYRRLASEAEERARVLQTEKDDQAFAIKTLKDEALQLTKQRDEAYVVRDTMVEERDAIATELEAFRQRGGELRPFAEAAVSKGIDRLAEIFEVHNPAVHRETFEECQSSLVEDLMARRLSDMISLAHAGEIEWASLRYLIWSYYQVDPGPEPVDPDWQPPTPEARADDSDEAPPPPQEETH